jgi:hypothetical protein
MKTYLLPFALATLAVSALAGAQTPPSSTSGTSSAPPSSTQAPSSTGSSAMSSSDAKAQLKDCVAKQKASNPQISDTEAKKVCTKTEPK